MPNPDAGERHLPSASDSEADSVLRIAKRQIDAERRRLPEIFLSGNGDLPDGAYAMPASRRERSLAPHVVWKEATEAIPDTRHARRICPTAFSRKRLIGHVGGIHRILGEMPPICRSGCFCSSEPQNASGQGRKRQVKRMNVEIAVAMHRNGVLGGLIGVRPRLREKNATPYLDEVFRKIGSALEDCFTHSMREPWTTT